MESDYLNTNVKITSRVLHLLKYLLSSSKEILLALCKDRSLYQKFSFIFEKVEDPMLFFNAKIARHEKIITIKR
jgi:hypothetical protein